MTFFWGIYDSPEIKIKEIMSTATLTTVNLGSDTLSNCLASQYKQDYFLHQLGIVYHSSLVSSI